MNMNDIANYLAPPAVKNMMAAQSAPAAPAAGARPNMALDGSEISKGPNQYIGAQSNSVTRPIGVDYGIFQGSADGATGAAGVGGVGAGVGTGEGVAGVDAGSVGPSSADAADYARGGVVRSRYYAGGGNVNAPSASAATAASTPEEAMRKYREIYGDPQSDSTQTTQPQSGGNPNDYIGQWAYDIGQGNIGGILKGPGMRALEKGDIVSALSPAAMVIKGLAEGGPVQANQQMAQHLASQGTNNDSMLVHMTPREVQGLGSLHPSGRMPINPRTGLPEADFLTDILPGIAGTVIGSVVGMPWLGAAVGGLGTWAATGNLGKGILSGLMSFGLGSLGGMLGEAGAGAAEGITGTAAKSAAGALDPSKMVSTSAIDRAIDPSIGSIAGDATAPTTSATTLAAPAKQSLGFFDKISSGFQNAPQTFQNIGTGIVNPQNWSSKMFLPAAMTLGSAYGLAQGSQQPPSAPQPMMPQQGQAPTLTTAANPPRIPTGGVVPPGYDPKTYRGELSYFQPNPAWGGYPSYAATGGQQHAYIQPDGTPYELAGGGVAQLPSGMIRGPGAGMDDKIKGTIDGRRDVYLSDGEYVVDAQTISALGDGSSKAGAQRMKKIVEEIRHKKFGSKKQPPKMAETGGLASLRSV
jgi:hypothetical protein